MRLPFLPLSYARLLALKNNRLVRLPANQAFTLLLISVGHACSLSLILGTTFFHASSII